VSREKLSPQQWARLEQELMKGPLAHGFAADQRWTLGRIKTLIGKLFRVGYTVEGTRKLMRRHGWPAQVPVPEPARDALAVAFSRATAALRAERERDRKDRAREARRQEREERAWLERRRRASRR